MNAVFLAVPHRPKVFQSGSCKPTGAPQPFCPGCLAIILHFKSCQTQVSCGTVIQGRVGAKPCNVKRYKPFDPLRFLPHLCAKCCPLLSTLYLCSTGSCKPVALNKEHPFFVHVHRAQHKNAPWSAGFAMVKQIITVIHILESLET